MPTPLRRAPGIALLGLALSVALAVPPGHTEAPSAATLRTQASLAADLDRLLADPRLVGAQAGVVVRDATTGEHLYTRNSDSRLLPASNAKLLTSAAAMDVLGPDYRFATTVLTDGRQAGPVLLGDLYLKGTGDPTMLAADYDRLAAAVAARGVRFVRGGLVADDTWFDDVRLGTDWAWDDEPFYYAAQVSALTVSPNEDFDAGTVIVEIRPGAAPGQPARVDVVPQNSYVHVVNQTTTGAAGSGDTTDVLRDHGDGNRIVVSGSFPLGGAATQTWSSVWNPTGYAAAVFGDALRRHGVRVLRGTEFRATPAGATELARHDSMPLSAILTPFLKLSNNGHAEILMKAMGRKASQDGSWDAGIRAARTALAADGVNVNLLRLVDGSGLARMDQVPAEQLSNLLIGVQGRPWFPVWYEALPIAGRSDRMVGGTLRSRMANTRAAGNVHAKTGSLTGVTALSGYVTTAAGQRLVFSVLQNNYLSGSPKDIEDAVAITLANLGAPGPAVASTPRPSTAVPDVECSWLKVC